MTIVSLLLVLALLVPSGAAGTAKFICTIGRGNAVTPEVVALLPAWQNLQFTSCVHPLPCLCSCYKIPLSTRRKKL